MRVGLCEAAKLRATAASQETCQGDMKAKVVILCGGMGTRLREETEFRPKRLVMGLRQSHVISLGDRGILAYFSSSWAASSSRTYPVKLF